MADELKKIAFTCMIIDDELAAAENLERMVQEIGHIQVTEVVTNSMQAVKAILLNKPDLIFLDIRMPGMGGFEILESLQNTNVRPFVIFITAFDQYAIRAIRSSAFDYLLKPVDKGELNFALERFVSRKQKQQILDNSYSGFFEGAQKKKIRFNTTGGFILVDTEDIIYIQADWNYSEIYLSKDKCEVVAMNLGMVEPLLPSGGFARISRSTIINLTYLARVLRSKRICILKKDDIQFEFKIPLLRIRELEEIIK